MLLTAALDKHPWMLSHTFLKMSPPKASICLMRPMSHDQPLNNDHNHVTIRLNITGSPLVHFCLV